MMDLLWMILPVFLLRVEAQNLTEVTVELGQSATFNCSLSTTVHWLIEIRSQVKGLIAVTFTPDPEDAQYSVFTALKTKYVAMGNRLVITDVSEEDCRLYFCGRKTNNIIAVSDRFLLRSGQRSASQQSSWMWRSDPVVNASFALNVLLSVITGLVFISLCLKKKNRNYQVTDASLLTNQNAETLETPQYEEIQIRAPPAAGAAPECIYYKAQLPRPILPQY
ncbi:uncharacterized protein LOC121962889 [Plectropomus leopardus]|uniref:uncharacterized protein LOC121962889 n=1 Tax=Plectropomus leopardus TaxID=160734 RepID=UPI001C4D1366|nr:uncharacterized protein LOC121962889 [Plectropomus leopardus]